MGCSPAPALPCTPRYPPRHGCDRVRRGCRGGEQPAGGRRRAAGRSDTRQSARASSAKSRRGGAIRVLASLHAFSPSGATDTGGENHARASPEPAGRPSKPPPSRDSVHSASPTSRSSSGRHRGMCRRTARDFPVRGRWVAQWGTAPPPRHGRLRWQPLHLASNRERRHLARRTARVNGSRASAAAS